MEQTAASQSEAIGYLVGLLCGGLVSIGFLLALVFWFVRRAKAAAAAPPSLAAAGCPSCGGTSVNLVTYTWWGGALGPKLLNHVRCAGCKAEYNSKTGRSNGAAIGIYVGVSITIGLVIGGILFSSLGN